LQRLRASPDESGHYEPFVVPRFIGAGCDRSACYALLHCCVAAGAAGGGRGATGGATMSVPSLMSRR